MYTCHGIHKDVKKIFRNQSSLSIMWVRLRRNVAQERKHLQLIRRVKTKTKLQGWLTMSWDKTFTVCLRAASESAVNTPALSSVLGGPSSDHFALSNNSDLLKLSQGSLLTVATSQISSVLGPWGRILFPVSLSVPFPLDFRVLKESKSVHEDVWNAHAVTQ